MDDGEIGWRSLGEAVLFLLAFIFAAAQSALVSVNKGRIKEKIEEEKELHNYRYKELLSVLERRREVLDLLWLFNAIVTIGIVVNAIFILQKLNYAAGFWKSIILCGFAAVYLVFFQIFPRTFAFHCGERFALLTATFLKFLTIIFSWAVKLCQFLADGLTNLVWKRDKQRDEGLSEEEIRMVLSKGKDEPVIEEEAKELIESIVEFGETIVKEVMVPRIDMVVTDVKSSVVKVLELAVTHGFSRFPVYEETVDNIVGIVYLKDLLPLVRISAMDIPIREKMRAPKYVPENKKVHELLREMQKERVPLAIVLDEYGGTEGLVTMEDLLEEIVGEITDVHDKEAQGIEKLSDGSYLIDGKINIEDLNAQLDLELPFEEFESIGGFVYGQIGRVPKEGEQIEFANVILEASHIHRQRIAKVRIIYKEDIEKKGINNYQEEMQKNKGSY